MGALSQFLLVAWLTPADFGLFAAANASLIVLVALTNLGEVNAYLTGKVSRTSELLTTTRAVNSLLALAGCVVALGFYASGSEGLSLMIALVALTIPLMGGSLAWNAVAIRAMNLRTAITGQFVGATAKLSTGVMIAAATESAVALPLSLAVGALANSATTRWMLNRNSCTSEVDPLAASVRSRFDRVRWGAQSLVQFFGAQSDYLVIAILASPHVLGIYFLAYQATVGVSALVSGPLMKSGLVELGRSSAVDLQVTKHLALRTSGYVALMSAAGGGVVMASSPYFPGAWSAAGAPLIMLLGSLTGRLLTPVLEAQLLATEQVGRSFWINVADIIGTAAAALVVLTGDVLWVAFAVSVWKVTVSGLRCLTVFRGRGVIIILPALMVLIAHAGLSFGAPQGSALGAVILVACGVLALFAARVMERIR